MKCIIKFVDDGDTTITISDIIAIRMKDHRMQLIFPNDTISWDVYRSLPYYIKENYKPSIIYDIIDISLDTIDDLIIKQL